MKNCWLMEFSAIGNKELGYLTALEENKNIPFDIKRVYYTFKVPSGAERGFHAHRELEQVLICMSGSITVKCFDGEKEEEYVLDGPTKGVYLGTMVWHEMVGYDENTVIMVLASDYYSEADYIRNYDDFMAIYKNQ